LAQATGLSSGTLYPMLARLADRGLLETEWERDPPLNRPRRHLYRLSDSGAELAAELAAERPVRARRRPALRPLADGA
jgi:DNA-binding PadR family transcriptional regulator